MQTAEVVPGAGTASPPPSRAGGDGARVRCGGTAGELLRLHRPVRATPLPSVGNVLNSVSRHAPVLGGQVPFCTGSMLPLVLDEQPSDTG